MQQNADLEKLLAYYQSIIHAKKHLANLNERLEEEQMNLDDLHLMLEKEYQDVKKLENLSITSLFHTFLGKKEEQYEIEKQEYLQAANFLLAYPTASGSLTQTSAGRLPLQGPFAHVKKPRRTFQVCLRFSPRPEQNLLTLAQSCKFKHTLTKPGDCENALL